MTRRYDKGERRYKHEGSTTKPVIDFDNNDPKKWIGKCPRGISDQLRDSLLNEAIPPGTTDRELSAPKAVYVVHDGAVYEAQTSDGGISYHAYPYRGKMPGKLVKKLRDMAKKKKCLAAFNKWVKEHIVYHGSAR